VTPLTCRKRAALSVLLLSLPAVAAPPPEGSPDRARRRSPIVEVFEQARDAVVNVSTEKVIPVRGFDIFSFGPLSPPGRLVKSVGSGVVIHPAGYIVTNAHVIAQASDIRVTFADGHEELAEVVARDTRHDLAVLKVSTRRPLPRLKLGRSDDVMVGETVVAIGNPLGLEHSVTAGIVSALNRDIVVNEATAYRGLIQTDAPINPGNSGGPLLNINGEVIGINTAIRGDAQNIGFAIPVKRLWELLPAMLDIERHQRVRVGLKVSGPDSVIEGVRKGTPAATAGLKTGDRILHMDGQELRDGIDYYVRLLNHEPGDSVRLGVKRGSQTLDVTLKLEPLPPPDGRKLAQELLGLSLVEIPRKLRDTYGLPARLGLMVEKVERGSPAWRSGIEPGDLVVELDRIPATRLDHVGLLLEQKQPGEDVLVQIIRPQRDGLYIYDPIAIPVRR